MLPRKAIWAILFIWAVGAAALERPDTTIGIDLGTTYELPYRKFFWSNTF